MRTFSAISMVLMFLTGAFAAVPAAAVGEAKPASLPVIEFTIDPDDYSPACFGAIAHAVKTLSAKPHADAEMLRMSVQAACAEEIASSQSSSGPQIDPIHLEIQVNPKGGGDLLPPLPPTSIVDEAREFVEGLLPSDVGDLIGDVPIPGIGLEEVCSGGGTTILGFATRVSILGVGYQLPNSAASSYATFFYDSTTEAWFVDGYMRSLTSNFKFVIRYDPLTGNPQQIGSWDFLGLPMWGDASLGGSCTLMVVTSFSVAAAGSFLDLGVPMVHADGRTCLVPC